MPAATRAAMNQIVQDNGAPPDEITWGAYSALTAEEEDWMDVDENEGPVDASHAPDYVGFSEKSLLYQ